MTAFIKFADRSARSRRASRSLSSQSLDWRKWPWTIPVRHRPGPTYSRGPMLLRCRLPRVHRLQRMPRSKGRFSYQRCGRGHGDTRDSQQWCSGGQRHQAGQDPGREHSRLRRDPSRGRSTAAIQTDGAPICVLGLSHTASPAVSFSGNSSFAAKGCAVYSNSALRIFVQSRLGDGRSGGFLLRRGSIRDIQAPRKSPCREKEDPFASLVAPVTIGCDYSSTNATSVSPNGTKSFAPGTYCATLDIKGTATLAPGVYVLKNGLNIAAKGAPLAQVSRFI